MGNTFCCGKKNHVKVEYQLPIPLTSKGDATIDSTMHHFEPATSTESSGVVTSNIDDQRPPSVTEPSTSKQANGQEKLFKFTNVTEFESLLEECNNEFEKMNDTNHESKSIPETRGQETIGNPCTVNRINEASTFLNNVAGNIEACRTYQTEAFDATIKQEVIKTFDGLSTLHWAGAALSLVAYVIKNVDQISQNKKECKSLLFDIMKLLNQMCKCWIYLKDEKTKKQLEDFAQSIVRGTVMCSSYTKQHNILFKFFNADIQKGKLEELRKEIDRAYQQTLLILGVEMLQRFTPILQPFAIPNPSYTVGLKEKLDEVLDMLMLEDTTSIQTILLHGTAGIGKTTLANAVCTHVLERHINLESSKWRFCRIDVGQNCTEEKICKLQANMIETLRRREPPNIQDHSSGQIELDKCFQELCKDNRHLFLYIDNILETSMLKNLLPHRLMLPSNSRLLITSRYNCCQELELKGLREFKLYEVKVLTNEKARDLLKTLIFDKQEVADQGGEIESGMDDVMKYCGGHPLALEVVGKHLKAKSGRVSAFKSVCESLKSWKPISGQQSEDKIRQSLNYCFMDLTRNLQEKFLDIIAFWKGVEWEDVVLYIGEEDLLTLQGLAFVRQEIRQGEVKIVDVHDLFVALGRRKMKETGFRIVEEVHRKNKALHILDKRGEQGTKDNIPIMGVCLENFTMPIKILDSICITIRVLIIEQVDVIEGYSRETPEQLYYLRMEKSMPFQCLEDMTKLMTLDLKGVDMKNKKIPENLRVLKMCECITSPKFPILHPSIQFVQMVGCSGLQELLWRDNLTQTRHALRQLVVESCEDVMELSEDLKYITSLEKLHIRNCPMIQALPNGFGCLPILGELEIRGCENLKELPKDLKDLKSLKKLSLVNYENLPLLPNGFGGLPSLSNLDLSGCKNLTELHEEIKDLKSLESLYLTNCENLMPLPNGFGGLAMLSNLDLSGCKNLKELPEEIKDLKSLESLHLMNCENLTSLPNSFGALPMLRKLDLSGCKNLTELPCGFKDLKSLESLYLMKCENLTLLPSGFGGLPMLSKLHLSECKNLKQLPEDFKDLKALKELSIVNCETLASLPSGFGVLPMLWCLHLIGCKNFKELPKDFKDLKSLNEVCIDDSENLTSLPDGFGCLSKISKLDLRGCKNLNELPEDLKELKSLQLLGLDNFESLTSLPSGFGGLPMLRWFYLSGCKNLKELPEDLKNLDSLEVLYVRNCENLTSLPDGFGGLTMLSNLDLSGCKNLKELPKDFKDLKSLQLLCLADCKNLTMLPNGFGGLPMLNNLDLSGCENLRELPGDFKDLKSLKQLNLVNCEKLTKLPSGFGGLGMRLSKLNLNGCKNLKKLPHNVMTLECLEIDAEYIESPRFESPEKCIKGPAWKNIQETRSALQF